MDMIKVNDINLRQGVQYATFQTSIACSEGDLHEFSNYILGSALVGFIDTFEADAITDCMKQWYIATVIPSVEDALVQVKLLAQEIRNGFGSMPTNN